MLIFFFFFWVQFNDKLYNCRNLTKIILKTIYIVLSRWSKFRISNNIIHDKRVMLTIVFGIYFLLHFMFYKKILYMLQSYFNVISFNKLNNV